MLDQLIVCDTKEIAAKVFASTPTFVIQQKELGHFPQPSWRTPGNRGKLVWLVGTVELWLAEYTKRAPDESDADTVAKRRACRAMANAAAVEATKIAEAYDARSRERLFNNNRSAGSATPGASENGHERISSQMVAD